MGFPLTCIFSWARWIWALDHLRKFFRRRTHQHPSVFVNKTRVGVCALGCPRKTFFSQMTLAFFPQCTTKVKTILIFFQEFLTSFRPSLGHFRDSMEFHVRYKGKILKNRKKSKKSIISLGNHF